MMESNQELLGFIKSKLNEWEEYRDNNYEEKWNEYYRLWRGVWNESDKTRSTERSRLISPALQQAVESTTAEIEEAVFGKGYWFDVSDDVADPEKNDAYLVRNLLREDFDLARTKEALTEIIFNGTLYGTGIGEITLEPVKESILIEVPRPGTIDVTDREVVSKESMVVKLRPVSPGPAGRRDGTGARCPGGGPRHAARLPSGADGPPGRSPASPDRRGRAQHRLLRAHVPRGGGVRRDGRRAR